jgi:hypothetical protein
MILEIQRNQQYTFEWSFFDMNIKEVPTSGTITVYNPGGTTELVSSTAVAIETDGTIKYTLAAANTGTVDKNYKIQLTYQVGDVVTRPFYLFNIVETPLINTVRDEDLFHYVPELRNKITTNIIETTTTSASTTTFISTELNPLNLDFKGGYCSIYITDTIEHKAEIQVWNSDTSTITFSPAYSSAISSGLKVQIRASFQRFINEAYQNHVYRDIRNRVPLAAGFIDSTVTDNLTIFKTLEIICFGKVEETDDKWDMRAKKFNELYGTEYLKLNEAYDYNEDGDIDTSEENSKPNFMNRGITR